MSQVFFTTLTAIGEAKHANAAVTGTKVNYAQMEVGDGNGEVPLPDRLQESLVNRVRIENINTVMVDPDNASQIIVEQVIPEDEGGWWIREVGIRDLAGDLIAVASVPPTYKPVLLEGSGRNQIIRVVLLLASTDVVALKIDPAIVMATRKYVDDIFAAPSGVVPGTYGSESEYPIITVNAQGRITDATKIKVASVWDAIPDVYIGDIIFVKDIGEMWWTDNAFITGYRTKWCGISLKSLDLTNRTWTLSMRGGTFDKTLKKYQGIYSWILENDLMVDAGDYEDGEGFFAEIGGNMVKAPNLDNMFDRNIGTDLDTANARLAGSKQKGSLQTFDPDAAGPAVSGLGPNADVGVRAGFGLDSAAGATYPNAQVLFRPFEGSTASVSVAAGVVRPDNTAFHPVICL